MDDFLALVERFRDGDLTPEEAAALEEALRTSPEARTLFVEQCLLETQLYSATALPTFSDPKRQVPATENTLVPAAHAVVPSEALSSLSRERSLFRSWIPICFGLAASLLLVALLWWNPWQTRVSPGDSTTAVAGTITEFIGDVLIVDGEGKTELAAPGRSIRVGEKVQTKGEDSWVALALPDATQMQLGPDCAVSFPNPADADGTSVRLEAGAIQVHASKQPPDRPLILGTTHARVVVLGTKFRLYQEENASRVELEEGTVRLVRTRDGKQVEVPEGSVAVASAHGEPEWMGPLPLSPAEARLRLDLPRAGHKIAFGSDGKLLAAGRMDQLKICSTSDGKALDKLTGHKDSRFGLVFSPGADTLFSLSDAKKLTAWETDTGSLRSWPLLGRDGVRDGAISADARWLALGQVERKMLLWSLEKGEPQRRLELATPDHPTRVALSRELPSGFPRLAYGQWVGNIEVLDLHAKGSTVVRRLKLSRGPTALALSGNGRLLATCSLPDGLQLWQLPAGEKLDLWTSQAARIECLRFSPDGEQLAAGMTDGTVRVWSSRDGQCLLVLDAGCRVVRDVTFSPDGAMLAAAGDNGLVRLWECTFHPITEKR